MIPPPSAAFSNSPASIPTTTSSAYPARARLARRMADAGACLAALSLAPKDVMCRLRVYPLAAVSQLSACIGLGRRAEFEFESLVRLMWM